MPQQVLIKRTSTDNSPPVGLVPGELAIEMGSPTRLWVGVPTSIDVSGKKLLNSNVIVADAAPVTPAPSTLWWESDSGILWLYYVDVDSAQWVQAAGSTAVAGNFVLKTGDTMTGVLYAPAVNVMGSTPAFRINKNASGETNYLIGQMAGAARWGMHLGDADAETGTNSGSNFSLNRCDDGGNLIGTAVKISRATGAIDLNGDVYVMGTVGISGLINGQQGIVGRNISAIAPSAAGDASFLLTDETGLTKGTIVWTRADNTIRLNNLVASMIMYPSGLVAVGAGMMTRDGSAGVMGSNGFNIGWTGTAQLWIDSTNVGTITIVSDYRTKKDVVDLSSMWDVVKALRPISYTQAEWAPTPTEEQIAAGQATLDPLFIADDTERWGFIAHELQETLLPSAATGVKDQENLIQSPNPMTIIAALTKALQEAMQRIEALEATNA